MIRATLNGTDAVLILHIQAGSPKDCKELLIVYSTIPGGIIGCEFGDGDVVMAKLMITE